MTQTNYKRVPFDIKLAKKITNKETKGRIVTRDGRRARIICFDRNEVEDIFDHPKNIIALVENKEGSECVFEFRNNGIIILNEETDYDLLIEIPKYSEYSNFEPQNRQPCLVRDFPSNDWVVTVCAGKDSDGNPIFYSRNYSDSYCHYGYFLPLTKITERLIGTNKSYDELVKRA